MNWPPKIPDIKAEMLNLGPRFSFAENAPLTLKPIKISGRNALYDLYYENSNYVLKITRPGFPNNNYEGKVLGLVNQVYTGIAPGGYLLSENYLIMESGSNNSIHPKSIINFFRKYAEFQIKSETCLKSPSAVEIRNESPQKILTRLPLLLSTNSNLRLSQHQINILMAKGSKLISLIHEYKVPITLEHGDVHDGNLIEFNLGECRLIDWETASINHPFLCLVCYFYESSLSDELKFEIVESYLAPWQVFEPMERLRELLELIGQYGSYYYTFQYLEFIHKYGIVTETQFFDQFCNTAIRKIIESHN